MKPKPLTARQLCMEHCHHGRATLVYPGWQRKLTAHGYIDFSTYKCPDCGFKWTDEEPVNKGDLTCDTSYDMRP